jgi:hypothetical protein
MNLLTKNKMFVGVIGLIAITSIVNTQAIISLGNYIKGSNDKVVLSAEDQEAQVFLSSQVNNCLKIDSPLGTRTSESFNGQVGDQNYIVQEYLIGVSIQNICPHKVYIVNPSSFWGSAATLDNPVASSGVDPIYGDIISEPAMTNNFKVGTSSFPGLTFFTDPIPSEFLSNSIPSLLMENLVQEFTSVAPIDVISLESSQISGISAGPNFAAYGLNSKVKRKFWYLVSVVQPGVDGVDENFSFTKVAMRSLKWFRESSLSDSMLTSSELRTFNISSSSQKFLETSGVRMGQL